jgi:hypothetical protein
MDEHLNDTWNYIWGSLQFSSKKAYKILQGYTQNIKYYKVTPKPPHYSNGFGGQVI